MSVRILRLAAALLAVSLCGSSASAAAATPYTIEVITSLTGPAAFVGTGVQRTLRILQSVVNDGGGIHGRPVAFNFSDDQSSPQQAVQITNQLLGRGVPVIVGPSVAATCGAVVPVVGSRAVAYCLSPALHPEAGSFLYSAGMSTNDILAAAMRYFRLRGLHRIALITSTDASGIDAEHAFDYAASLPENRRIVRVANEHFAVSDMSVSAQAARMKQAAPEVVFAWTTGPAFSTILRGVNDAGLDVPVATSTGNMSIEQMSQLPGGQRNDIYAVGFRYFDRANIGSGPLKSTVDKLYQAYDRAHLKPDVQPGLVWDAATLVVAALRDAGSNPSAQQVKSFIDKQRSYVGIDGLYNYPGVPQRGLNDLAGVVCRWNATSRSWEVRSRPGGTPR